MATLSFMGAAGTVTGSCSLVEEGGVRFLVDCGMFQGNRTVRELNFKPFPFDAKTIDFLILTHAHIDHSGLLPKLTKAGFNGPIYCTRPTMDLLEFMLLDSAHIQESNVERLNRRNQRRNLPELEPLYTRKDAEDTLKLLQSHGYEEWFEPAKGMQVRFWNAGHILGSASAEVKIEQGSDANLLRMLFSGDLGPDEKVFHPEPSATDGFDYIVCESTYGNRDRDDYTLEKRRAALRDEIIQGHQRGGNIVIPSFAVERSQELLHDIGALMASGELPEITVFLDSPLANKVTEVFIKYADTLDDLAVDEAALFRDKNFRLVKSVDESKAINRIKGGAIIISASGMCDAGRIKHHLINNLWRKEATVLFVGFQAPGTLGSVIRSGEKDVRIHGKNIRVRATIRSIGNYSAHADQGELVDWIMERGPVVGRLFLNHGEDESRTVLRDLLATKGIDKDRIVLPQFDESFDLVAGTARSKGRAPARIADSQLTEDWHNRFAAFSLALANRIEQEPDAGKRSRLIEKLAEALEGEG